MIIYTIIGIIWSVSFNWLLTNFSEDGTGLDTIKQRLLHIFFWPIAMLIVIHYVFGRDEEDEE